MGLPEFIDKSKQKYRERGVETIPEILGEFFLVGTSRLIPLHKYGRRVYDYDWDILVVLDACRADMYRETIDSQAETVWSCAGTSTEWMRKNFTEKYHGEMSNTAYICGNPYSDQLFSAPGAELQNEFELLDEVWKYGWDDELGTIPAPPITDRAISVHREMQPDRLIIHYMQPHYPFIGSDESWGWINLEHFGEGKGKDVWNMAMRGEIDFKEVRKAYYDNLRYVWEYVEILQENLDGDMVITADHGNAYGKLGIWGHRGYVPAPGLRRVPWDRRQAVDEGTYEPELTDSEVETADTTVEDRLNALGYR